MRHAAKRIAYSMRRAAERHAEAQGSKHYEGTLVRWNSETDFLVELHYTSQMLHSDIVTLGQTVRAYDRTTGIVAGDVLVLLELAPADYVAVEVRSDN